MTETLPTNKHLKQVAKNLRNYLENDEEPPLALVAEFMVELRVSNLIAPVLNHGEYFTLENIESEDTGEVFIPVFTDIEEYEKHARGEEEYIPMPFEFNVYMDAVSHDDLDGLFVNVMGEYMPLDKNFLSDFDVETDTLDETVEPYSPEELKEIFDNVSNDCLIEFIKSDDNQDIEKLYVELSNSTMLCLIGNEKSSDEVASEGIIKIDDADGFNLCISGDDDISLGVMFTDVKAMDDMMSQNPDLFYCAQIIPVSDLFEYVLRNDMDGVVINPYTDDYLIARDDILPQARGIEIIAGDMKLKHSLDYAFPL